MAHHPASLWLKRHVPFNRQTYLRDVSAILPPQRRARSRWIQFYSSYRNIGNFLPVLGIQGMLGEETDVWNMHERPVDWDFVHRHYRGAIIGGAGLLHASFDPFWREFAAHNRLPYTIWGIGVCLPQNEGPQGVDRGVAREVFAGAALANVRDRLTVEHYGLGPEVDVAVCPTVPYLHERRRLDPRRFDGHGPRIDVLHSIHTTLIERSGVEHIEQMLRATGRSVQSTENLQRYRCGIDDVLALYPRAKTVVSTRLHGAIIAYGFDVPYIALSYDPKVRAFVELYGGGRLCERPQDLPRLLDETPAPVGSAAAATAARAFGQRARALMQTW